MAMPDFAEELLSAMQPTLESFAAEKRLWSNAIEHYNPNKHSELIAECESLCKQFLTVEQRIESAGHSLRNLYMEKSVFIEIILIDETEFRSEYVSSLLADYSQQFLAQSKFFSDAENLLNKLKADSRFWTFFSFKKVYRLKYGALLEEARRNMDSKRRRWCTELNRTHCHGYLRGFVDELNEYGQATFNVIQKHSNENLEEMGTFQRTRVKSYVEAIPVLPF